MERFTSSIDYSGTHFCARVYEAPETMPRGHLDGPWLLLACDENPDRGRSRRRGLAATQSFESTARLKGHCLR